MSNYIVEWTKPQEYVWDEKRPARPPWLKTPQVFLELMLAVKFICDSRNTEGALTVCTHPEFEAGTREIVREQIDPDQLDRINGWLNQHGQVVFENTILPECLEGCGLASRTSYRIRTSD